MKLSERLEAERGHWPRTSTLDAVLAEAAELARSGEWQPIETEPKDGTRVLLWIEWSDVPVVGEFSHGRWWADTEHHEVSCGVYCYGGTVSTDKGMNPTHWRPLPDPPRIVPEDGQGGGE